MKVLVVGAGPTGLTAATELARQGADVTLIEKRSTASNFSRAVGILPSSMRVFERFGAADAVRGEAIAFSDIAFYHEADLLLRLPLNFDERSRIWGLAQDRTESHIADAFVRYGGSIHYGAALETFRQDESCVTAQIEGKGENKFDYIIGADGVRSVVRQTLGIPFDGFELDEDWSIADVDVEDWPEPSSFKGYLLPGGHVCIVVPLEAARFRVIASRPDALSHLPVPMNITNIRRAGDFRIAIRQVPRYSEGRVFLAGDAAHCHSPAGGRGMNLGISDAAELAERMIKGTLDPYSESRHAAGQHVIAFSERGRTTLLNKSAMKRKTLRGAMRVLNRVDWLKPRAAHQFLNG